jgi:hypothetical protein
MRVEHRSIIDPTTRHKHELDRLLAQRRALRSELRSAGRSARRQIRRQIRKNRRDRIRLALDATKVFGRTITRSE